MTDRLNKTSICSIVFLDIIDYSKKSVSEQIDDKTLFNALINEAIENVAQNDRIIIDTGDGAAITLMGAPEEALFVALTIRDGILDHNKTAEIPLLVRIGINLGSVRVVKDINDRPNIIGDGINVAQRIMSFSGENQILVSRSYYEVTSRLTKEITGMFTYSGIKQDKHVREHEVYLIKPKDGEEVSILDEAVTLDEPAGKVGGQSNVAGNMVKQSSLLIIGTAVLLFALLAWLTLKPSAKPLESDSPQVEELEVDKALLPLAKEPILKVPTEKTATEKAPESNKAASVNTSLEKNNAKKAGDSIRKKRTTTVQKSNNTHQQSTQKTVKQVTAQVVKHVCTQVEITLNQCKK